MQIFESFSINEPASYLLWNRVEIVKCGNTYKDDDFISPFIIIFYNVIGSPWSVFVRALERQEFQIMRSGVCTLQDDNFLFLTTVTPSC